MFRRLALVAVLSALAGSAHAQTTTPTTPTLQASDFVIRVSKPIQDSPGWAFLTNDVERMRYFNAARCRCNDPIRISVDITSMPPNRASMLRGVVGMGNYTIRIGNSDCIAADPTSFRNAKCTDLQSGRLTDLVAGGTTVDTTVGELFRAPNIQNGASCTAQQTQNVWLLVDYSPLDTMPDQGLTDASGPHLEFALDGSGPPAPIGLEVAPGNEALSVKWKSGGLMGDQNGYVVFCSRGDMPVFNPSFYSTNQFATAQTACFKKKTSTSKTTSALTEVTAADATPPATTIQAPDAFRQLNPDYVCSDLLTSGTSWRIKGLQNGIPYVVGVASVDKQGNAAVSETAVVQTPVVTVGFYDAYKAAGGEASGCSYGRGGAGRGALALLGLLGLLLRRRR